MKGLQRLGVQAAMDLCNCEDEIDLSLFPCKVVFVRKRIAATQEKNTYVRTT